MRLFTFLVLALLYNLASVHCRRRPKGKFKSMKSFYRTNQLIRGDSSSSEDISINNRHPSLSCLLFSDAGCETSCNVSCDLYHCQSRGFCQNKMFCLCNEVYTYKNKPLSADEYKQLSFDELWNYKFADTPLSRKLRNRISQDEDASMYFFGMLQNPHKTGNDIKSSIASYYPEYKDSGLRQLQTRDLDIKKDLLSDHENLEHYIQDMIGKMKGPVHDKISHTRYIRRLIQLVKNISNKNDLKYILRQVRLTGNDRLYKRFRKYLIKKKIYFDDDEEFGLQGRRMKKICGNGRNGRKCKEKNMFYVDDEDYDEDDETIELALMKQLMNTAVDSGQHFVRVKNKNPATDVAEDIAMANVMSLNNSPRPSLMKEQSETYFIDEYPQTTSQNKLTSAFIQNNMPFDKDIIEDSTNVYTVENLPTPRPGSSITQNVQYTPTLVKTANTSPDVQYMEYFSSLPNSGTQFNELVSRPSVSTITNTFTDVLPSSYTTLTSTSPGMNDVNTKYLSSIPASIQTQTSSLPSIMQQPIQNTDHLISNISPTEYLTTLNAPSPVDSLPESIQKPVQNMDVVTFDVSDTTPIPPMDYPLTSTVLSEMSDISPAEQLISPDILADVNRNQLLTEQPLANTVISEIPEISPTDLTLNNVEYMNNLPDQLIEKPFSNIDHLDTVALSPADQLTSSGISSALQNIPMQDEYLTAYDINDDDNLNILNSYQHSSGLNALPDSYDYLISEIDAPITQQTITSPQSEVITTAQKGKDNIFHYLIVDENGNIIKRSKYNYPGQTTYTQTVTNIPGQITHTTSSNIKNTGLLNSNPKSTVQKLTSTDIPVNEYFDEEAITRLMKNAGPTQSTIQKITSSPTNQDLLINEYDEDAITNLIRPTQSPINQDHLINEDYNQNAILNLIKNADQPSFGEKIDVSFLNNNEYDKQALLNTLKSAHPTNSINEKTITTIPGQLIHTSSNGNMGLMNSGTSPIQRITQGPTQSIQRITSTSPTGWETFANQGYNEEALKNAYQSVFGNKIDTSILNADEYDRSALLNTLKSAHQTDVNRVAQNFQSGVNAMNRNANANSYGITGDEQYEYFHAADENDFSDGDYEVHYDVAVNDEDDIMNF